MQRVDRSSRFRCRNVRKDRPDKHYLHGKVRLDLYSGRIVLALDVERCRADFIISADNVEDPMDLGRGSGVIGARWHTRGVRESAIVRIMTTPCLRIAPDTTQEKCRY
jgi:hypothetical protein